MLLSATTASLNWMTIIHSVMARISLVGSSQRALANKTQTAAAFRRPHTRALRICTTGRVV